MKKFRSLIGIAAFAFAGTSLSAQPGQVSLSLFDTGYNGPVFLTHAGDARLFVVEQDGVIKITDQNGNVNGTSFLNINPRVGSSGNEQGLLGLAFHPKYKENGYFFVDYTNNSGNTVISRFSVSAGDPDVADPNSEMILLTITQPFSNHNGGCLQFGHDGYLYIGMGDGGSGGDPQGNGQSSTSRLGKILRLDVDNGSPYAIPPSNPYQSGNVLMREVWAFGVRNPWRYSFDRLNGDLWMGDVGQDAWEEIDHLPYNSDPAPNFGWRCYEGNSPYNTNGCQPQGTYDPPIYVFQNNNSTGCSVTGGIMYRGGRYGSMNGTYFHTDYCTGYLWETRNPSLGVYNTIRGNSYETYDFVSFGEDVYGELYVLGATSGKIWRIADTSTAPIAMIWSQDSVEACGNSYELHAAGTPALSFQWQLNGVDILGADSSVYSATLSGNYTVIVANGAFGDTSAVVNVSFVPAPVVSFSGLAGSYCTIDIPDTLVGSPLGGVFSGPGVSGSTFSPSASGAGSFDIIYTYTEANGCMGTDTLSTIVAVCVGIGQADFLPGFQLYPNPANDKINFAFGMPESGLVTYEVIDINGRSVAVGQQDVLFGEFQAELELADIAAGIYTLRLGVKGQGYSKTFSIAH